MKRLVLSMLMAVVVCATGECDTKEIAKLNAWVMPNGMDNNPSDGNAGRYSVYMTEYEGEDVSALQDSVLQQGTEAMGCKKICDMFIYYIQNDQYCTYLIEYEGQADTSTVIDGKYHITDNTVAVFVYDDGESRDVSIVGDIYNTVRVYGCYFVDDTQPGERYAPWKHQRGSGCKDVNEDIINKVKKVIIDGKVYVEREGILYDMTGRIVRF